MRPTRRSCGASRTYPGRVRLGTFGREARGVRRRLPAAWSCRRWGLPCRRCRHRRGALLPHLFTIARSLRRCEERRRAVGCVFSVALSLGLLPVVVSHHRALGSPNATSRVREARDPARTFLPAPHDTTRSDRPTDLGIDYRLRTIEVSKSVFLTHIRFYRIRPPAPMRRASILSLGIRLDAPPYGFYTAWVLWPEDCAL